MLRLLASIASLVEWAIIVCILLMTMGVADPAGAGEVQPCNCVNHSIEALGAVHIRLRTIPSIGVNNWHRFPGVYSRGVVEVADINDCRVLLHEFIHHWQWLQHGDALDFNEWQRRELQATLITARAESETGGCIATH